MALGPISKCPAFGELTIAPPDTNSRSTASSSQSFALGRGIVSWLGHSAYDGVCLGAAGAPAPNVSATTVRARSALTPFAI